MCLLVETIRIQDGIPQNLSWHQSRMDESVREVSGCINKIIISLAIKVPDKYRYGTVKCRLIYDLNSYETEFSAYRSKKINCLRLLHDDSIEYKHKYADRTDLEKLLDRRGNADDILIISKGFLSDTSFSNIVFFDGKQWITPSTPLLRGTCRQRLLSEGKIMEMPLKPDDISRFSKFQLINAMRGFNKQQGIAITKIFY